MSVSDLYFQSALINAGIFFWIASAIGAARILIGCKISLAKAMITGLMLGPAAFAGAWIYEFLATKKNIITKNIRSLISILIISGFSVVIFYFLFVRSQASFNTSSEILISYIGYALMLLGFIGGVFLAAITKRVAFYEACWCAFFFALYALGLKEWAHEVFSYGTSTAYFSVIIITANFLYLVFLTIGGSLGYLLFGEGRLNLRFGFESFIGMRFLMTKRSSQVVSLITVISIIAVMIACGGMIVVMGVMNGFTSEFRSKILGANPHLMTLKYGKDFSEYEQVIDKTAKIPGILSATPFVLNEGLVSSQKNVSGALIKGIANLSDKHNYFLKYISEEGLKNLNNPKLIPVVHDEFEDSEQAALANDLSGVIIGKEMALDLQVMIGDVINIISPVGDVGPTGAIPRAKPFRIAGLFYSGMYEYDAKFVFIKLKDAQEFFNLGNTVSGVEYRVADVEKTRVIASEIEKAIGGYPFYTRDWMQMNRNMFSALQLEKIAMLIILGTLIFMASLLILVTLIMVVMEKGKEIAILKSMGATDASIMKIFVTYGLFVGVIGAGLGGLLGLALCYFIEKVGIRLDPDVYYFSSLPVQIINNEILMVVGSAILISFLATIPPSLFAARLKPVEGLRYE